MKIWKLKSYWDEDSGIPIREDLFTRFPSETDVEGVYPHLMFNYQSLVRTGAYTNPHTGFTIEITKVYA